MERDALAGALSGAVAGGLVAAAGLMKVKGVAVSANKTVIQSKSITSTPTTLLSKTNYKFAIVLFHGDGDATLTITVQRGSQTFTLTGAEQAIELVVNEDLSITASSGSGLSPTIEIASITW